jgi:hypothetical protein
VLAVAVAALLVCAPSAGARIRRTPTLAPTNSVIDGPSSDIVGLSGLASARDGTGGVVYLKDVAGSPHVFVSALRGGTFQTPVQVDPGLLGPSSEPVIAGTNGGLLVVAFINGGQLYVTQAPGASQPWSAPQALYANASHPSLSMSTFGKAYVAFTAAEDGGDDVRTAYYYQGEWALGSGPLNASPGDDAGTGTGRPQIVTSGDGTAIATWGEGGHIYVRRVLGTSPSVSLQQADPSSFGGLPEISATDPVISSGGDSSYAAVVFSETLSSGGGTQTRVLMNHLQAGLFDGTVATDGITTAGFEDADQPAVGVTEFGNGFSVAEQTATHNLYATYMSLNEFPDYTEQVNTLPQASPPDAVAAPAGTVSTLIAWQQDTSPPVQGTSLPEIRLRYAPDGQHLNPDEVISSPTLGATDADLGLFAGGDLAGDALAAWVQGSGGQTRIMAGQLYQAPGGFHLHTPRGRHRTDYQRTQHPVLSWTAASESWGNPLYVVKLDGVQLATTSATRIAVPSVVNQGRHVWQITAVNRAGASTLGGSSTIFVDSVPPRGTVRITGTRRVGMPLTISVRARDYGPGLPRRDASGVASVKMRFSGGGRTLKARDAIHVYTRSGTYRLTVTITDRAGNRTVLIRRLKIRGRRGRRHRRHGVRA